MEAIQLFGEEVIPTVKSWPKLPQRKKETDHATLSHSIARRSAPGSS